MEQDRCVGSGHCVLTAPEVFDQRAHDGVVVLLDPCPPQDRLGLVHEAVVRCPVSAIWITGADHPAR